MTSQFSELPLVKWGPGRAQAKETKVVPGPAVLSNFDIREQTTESAVQTILKYRIDAGLDASMVADIRQDFVRGEHALRQRYPDITVEYNSELRIPEVVSPNVRQMRFAPITERSTEKRPSVLRSFIKEYNALFGVIDDEVGRLVLTADYTNPDGVLSFVHFQQKINGIQVFGGEIKAGFTRRNQIVRIINALAPGLGKMKASDDFGIPEDAVTAAIKHIDLQPSPSDLTRTDEAVDGRVVFQSGQFRDRTVAEKIYFPVEPGVVRTAWRVLLWTPAAAYYVIVDAFEGSLLWRKNLTDDQAQPATYNVYGNTTSAMKTHDSPSPFTPGCLAPSGCSQPPAIARTNFTLIGNEAPYTFNNIGWIPDTGLPVRTPANPNITDGNNVEAGIDRIAPTGVDENGWAFGNPTRVFSYSYNPGPGLPPPGEAPLPPTQTYPPSMFQQGSITHGFYTINRWHDEMYRFGFTEVAGNFQHFNFGRGGSEGDRISFEIQDGSGTNGANFSTLADGGRGRLQMFIWTGPDPDRDGALDTQMVLHEITHGVSNRLHGNTTGLGSNMARGMGEGWSDFYALALLSEPGDDRLGTYTIAGYAIYLVTPGWESNYYYGLRRFPVAIFASRGPNGRPHNPLTFRHLNSNCNTEIGTSTAIGTISAYRRGPIGATQCDQIHNAGEIWAVTLWEVRDKLILRHGAVEGNRRVLQYVTDGMKLAPINPTFLQERDAILVAASVADADDVGPMWAGFAIRGLGSGAAVVSANPASVIESFDYPNAPRTPFDFDGDRASDVSIFRSDQGEWWWRRSSDAVVLATQFGTSNDKIVPADYTGDGKVDIAFFRPSAGHWFVLRSENSTYYSFPFGASGDYPVPADFDGDDKADVALYRPSTGEWWVLQSTNGTIYSFPFGVPADLPVVADFDGDSKADAGIWRRVNGQWWVLKSTGGVMALQFGQFDDKAVPGDYTGDGKADVALWRPSTGVWYVLRSEDFSFYAFAWGASGDLPAPGDYDGDGKTDAAVFRSGEWYVNRSSSGPLITSFGLPNDLPVAGAFVR